MSFFSRINFWQALTDVLLLIVGAVIAYQFNAYFDEKQDRQSELRYLKVMHQEFLDNGVSLLHHREKVKGWSKDTQTTSVFEHIDHILLDIAFEREIQPEELSTALGEAYHFHHIALNTSTYDDLVNSGKLDLITSPKVRKCITQFISTLETMRFFQQTLRKSYYEHQLPFINQHLNSAEFGWAGSYYEHNEAPHVQFKVNMEAVRSQEFWNLIYGWKITHADVVYYAEDAMEIAYQLLKTLELEISALEENHATTKPADLDESNTSCPTRELRDSRLPPSNSD